MLSGGESVRSPNARGWQEGHIRVCCEEVEYVDTGTEDVDGVSPVMGSLARAVVMVVAALC